MVSCFKNVFNDRMSVTEFISKYRTSLNNGQKKWNIWKSRAATNKNEVKLKEDGRLADIIMKGKKWNGRAVANNFNRQELTQVQNAMSEWERRHPIETTNITTNININTNNGSKKSFLNRLTNMSGWFGGTKSKRTHLTKRNRTKRNRTKRN